MSFPSTVATTRTGHGLVATADLDKGVAVESFDGPVVPWCNVPEPEVPYVLMIDDDQWVVPCTNARYINHSCDPNCRIAGSLEVITVRPVPAGEQLTISYNSVDPDEEADFLGDPEKSFWEPRWTFACLCGTPGCTGLIDRYVVRRGTRP